MVRLSNSLFSISLPSMLPHTPNSLRAVSSRILMLSSRVVAVSTTSSMRTTLGPLATLTHLMHSTTRLSRMLFAMRALCALTCSCPKSPSKFYPNNRSTDSSHHHFSVSISSMRSFAASLLRSKCTSSRASRTCDVKSSNA